MGVVSLLSERSARSPTSPGRVSKRQVLPLFGLGRGCSQRTQKAFGTAMRLCASLFRGAAAPLGCVICLQLGDVAVFSLCAQYFLNVRDGGAITTLGAFHTFRKPCVARCQNGKLCRFCALIRCAPEERREPSEQRCAYAHRCSEAPRPRWAALLCLQFGDVAVFSLCAQGFPHMRKRGWYHYPRCAPRAAETLGGRLSKRLICRFLGLTGSSLIPAAQNTVLFGHGIPTEKRLNRQRLIPPPAGRCGSNTAVSRSPGLSRGPRCPAPARTPQVSAPAP